MAVFNSLELWLICCTHTSVTLIIVSFDNYLWQKLLSTMIDIYHPNKRTIPTRLHPSIKYLKEDIKLFVSTHCQFVLEVPTITGNIGTPTVSSLGSLYGVSPLLCLMTPNLESLHDRLSVLGSECKLIFKETHACLRKPAREIGMFMLNNKDRMHVEYIPNCAPMAYVMKGTSLPIDTLQYLVNKCHDEIHTRNISILCEIYDGQWRNIVNQDCEGNPLTKFNFPRNVGIELVNYPKNVYWKNFSKLAESKQVTKIL